MIIKNVKRYLPENKGAIIRTAGENKKEEDINKLIQFINKQK